MPSLIKHSSPPRARCRPPKQAYFSHTSTHFTPSSRGSWEFGLVLGPECSLWLCTRAEACSLIEQLVWYEELSHSLHSLLFQWRSTGMIAALPELGFMALFELLRKFQLKANSDRWCGSGRRTRSFSRENRKNKRLQELEFSDQELCQFPGMECSSDARQFKSQHRVRKCMKFCMMKWSWIRRPRSWDLPPVWLVPFLQVIQTKCYFIFI